MGITYNEIGDVESILSGLPTGLYLQDVSDNKELTKAGIQKGDVITHFDGKEITGSTVVLSILENTPAGSKVTLTVYRADTGVSTDIEVTLMEYKGNSSYTTEKSSTDSDKSFDFPFGD